MEQPNNSASSRFNVIIRLRPELGDERNELTIEEDMQICVAKLSDKELKLAKPLNEEVRIFDFDRILSPHVTQEESYNRVASKIVDDVIAGYNGTIMAYGQTGSGKTFTIFGKKSSMDYHDDVTEDMGIVPRAVKQIFNTIRENSSHTQFQVRVSFLQVYMEQITDLIQDENDETGISSINSGPMVFTKNKKNVVSLKEGLQIREDPQTGIFVKGLKQIRVSSEEELLNLIKYGSKFRITSSTSMNTTSSRSHAILQIMVEQKWIESDKLDSDAPIIKKRHYKKGLLTIVDLAGSERISKSGSEGIRLEEAKRINTSVVALGKCINALANTNNMHHVPFRDSKLTRILTECLGGNSKTSICACVSPFLMNYDETITTLQFASRAIKIKVHATVNEKIEERKIKEKLNDFIKIQKMDNIIQENKKLEKDANDLKSSFNNFRDELKKAKSKNDFRRGTKNEDDIEEISSNNPVRSYSQNRNEKSDNKSDKNSYNSNSHNAAELQEYSSIAKKFHFMILHLQTELSRATVTINNLQEENTNLREKLARMNI